MEITNLIKKITPLYNEFKENRYIYKPFILIEFMWEIGEILKNYVKANNITPNSLFRAIYGKSENVTNITQKSYISRDFQNRCLRIRNMFSDKKQIAKEFKELRSFALFREAMPFLDNKKYSLKGKERKYLTDILKSDRDEKAIKSYLKKLQNSKIGIKNPRTQKLSELEGEKKVFIDFYNLVINILKKTNNQINQEIKKVNLTNKYLIILAKNTNTLTQDGLKATEFDELLNDDGLWKQYETVLLDFMNQTTAKKIRRFRRIIPSERIATLADMLFELSKKIN